MTIGSPIVVHGIRIPAQGVVSARTVSRGASMLRHSVKPAQDVSNCQASLSLPML